MTLMKQVPSSWHSKYREISTEPLSGNVVEEECVRA